MTRPILLVCALGTWILGITYLVSGELKPSPKPVIVLKSSTTPAKYGDRVIIKQLNKDGYIVWVWKDKTDAIVSFEQDGSLIERILLRNQFDIIKEQR
jgi:hypothetical protein